MAADFRLSKIVIMESLEEGEVLTGKVLCQYLRGLADVAALELPVEHRTCETKRGFLDLMSLLTEETKIGGHAPLLHVECHGDKDHGLEFANGSLLSWVDLSSALVELNKVSRFNLVFVVAACYGAHFLSRFSSIEAAPCYALVAPQEAVDPSELMAGFRDFYRTMFERRDAGVAVDGLLRRHRASELWFAQLAEYWYERVSVGYVENYCTEVAMRERCRRMFRKLQSEGTASNIGKLKRMLEKLNRSQLLDGHFSQYFMTDAIPENTARFKHVRAQVERKIGALRATGRYYV